ncbi:PREDICTED: protein takeout-like [Rhagoletis zephyria]|uniref:protein takeout-like n=1 Tax=Rhagoletis zephyria TaxID=28612 RepID=UPI00081124EF|nr:PREDICTED: protein takeout-like [Rhagoletis zephyria]
MAAKLCGLAILLALTVQISFTESKHLAKKPDFLIPCDFNDDANLNTCCAKNFQLLLTGWGPSGIPGLNLGSLDPLTIKRIKVQQNTPPLVLDAILENLVVTGATEAVVNKVVLDKKTLVLDARLELPKLHAVGNYKVKGSVLGLNINGQGDCTFDASKIRLAFHLTTKLRDEGDLTFSEVLSFKAKILEIGDFHIDVMRLFDGQPELTSTANDLFNQNWRELFGILGPTLEQTLEAVLGDRLMRMYKYIPASYLFVNLPTASAFYG